MLLSLAFIAVSYMALSAKTLVVYYSYTNNVHRIVTALRSQIDTDVIRIEPAEKGLDYAANNYAIGSAQIAAIRENPDNAASYPAIDPVTVNLDEYDTVIVAAPLWWSNMAAPLQTFLFGHGNEMAGKNIGSDSVKCKQRDNGRGSRCAQAYTRRQIPVTELMDQVVTDLKRGFNDNKLA